jgi:hypothetical protein
VNAGPRNTFALLSAADVNDAKEVLVNKGSASINGPEQINLSSKIAIGTMHSYSDSDVFVFKIDTPDERGFTTSESRSVEGNIPRE